jgi:pimeloyl-ACP methyl ester carboxylesterase
MADVFVGGLDDGAKNIVKGYFYGLYKPKHFGSMEYFSWEADEGIVNYLDRLPPDEQINLIGHSYGGDTVGKVAADYKRRINVLVTVDPVGSHDDIPFSKIKGNCAVWVDVNSNPHGLRSSFNLSNIGAGIGYFVGSGDWGETPKGFTTYYIESSLDHEQFSGLLAARGDDGQIAISILQSHCAAADNVNGIK